MARAIDVLKHFSEENPDWGALELSRVVGLTQSTVHRLLTTLEAASLLERNEMGRFRLGLGMVALSGVALSQMDLYRHSLPVCADLAARTGLSATSAVAYHGQAMYIARVDRGSVPRGASYVGKLVPMHCTAAGKVLLAHMPSARVDEILGERGLRALTERTVTDRTVLFGELAAIRERGYAMDTGEMTSQQRAVAVPVFNSSNEVIATLAVSGPQPGILDSDLKDLILLLNEGASAISFAMGNLRAYA